VTKDEKKQREAFFIAYKENIILEKYFTRTFQKSEYEWSQENIKETEALIDKSQPYVSPVSSGLFTSFGEKTMWISIFIFLACLILFNIWITPKLRK